MRRIAEGRYIAYLPGPGGNGRRLRLVGGDHSAYAGQVVRAIEKAVEGDDGAHVMLVGSAQGGVTAAEVAATVTSEAFVIDHVVTAGSPSAHGAAHPRQHARPVAGGPRRPGGRAGLAHQRGQQQPAHGRLRRRRPTRPAVYVAGGRAADTATHPELQAEIQRIHAAGYLAG